jgi:hypothetical protein
MTPRHPLQYFYGPGIKRWTRGKRYDALVRPLSHKDESSTAPHVLFIILPCRQLGSTQDLPEALLPYQGKRYASRGSATLAAKRLKNQGVL